MVYKDVYETVCSFLNRCDGYIIMGVENDGTPIGINLNVVKDMKKNFVDQFNKKDNIVRKTHTKLLKVNQCWRK